jgi:hypothetical protein
MSAALFSSGNAAVAQVTPVVSVVAQLPLPAPDVLMMMIRVHVIAVGQAIQAGNFEVVRALASQEFRAKTTNAGLISTFGPVAALNLDMSPVAVVTPVLTEPPIVGADQQLRLVGVFGTRPVELPFWLLFKVENGAWKLADVSVGARAAVVATASPPAPKSKK